MNFDLLEFFNDKRFADSGIVQRRQCAPNEKIITQGDHDRFMYVVESGQVRVNGRVDLEGSRHIQPGLVDLGPGAVFGELNLFDAGERSASVVAVDDCVLLRIDSADLTPFLDEHTDLGYQLLRHCFQVLTERLRMADKRIEGLFGWGLKAHGIERHLAD